MKLAIAAIAFTLLASSADVANAQAQCRLCGDTAQQIKMNSCEEMEEKSVSFGTCCPAAADLSVCPSNRACRFIEFTNMIGCGAPSDFEEACGGSPSRTMELELTMNIQSHRAECCASCSCAGDPHCTTFQKALEEWILCDGRDGSKSCAVTKAVCDQQFDQTKTQCVYSAAGNGKCSPNPLTPKPTMKLYQKGNNIVSLTLGERGIIDDIIIQEGNNVLSLSAATCKANPVNPWVGNPKGSLSRLKNGSKWEYQIPSAGAGVVVDCVYAGVIVTDPHLDVTIVDNTHPTNPVGTSGFCAGEKIPKEFSHDNSDMLHSTGVCKGKSANMVAAQYFNNGKGVGNAQKMRQIAKKFCYKYIAGYTKPSAQSGTGGSKKVKKCFQNIVGKGVRPGWPAAFCAANIILSKDALECATNLECNICMSDIEDFGWEYAIEKYDKTKKKPLSSGATCLTIDQLPPDLIGCEKGIRIQYQSGNTWITYKAIPYGYTLCETSGKFNSVDHPEIFHNPMRISQCGDLYDNNGECSKRITNKCHGEDTIEVKAKITRSSNVPQFGISELVEKGILVCKNKNDPTGCLSNPYTPCKSCKGPCPVKNWIAPCTNCGMCPA